MPSVCVVIPVYNPGDVLRLALASVIGQTFGDWECVVVDDGSVEDLSWVENVDPRVRLFHQKNSGPTAARNYGLRLCNAPFIAFLDQDDIWDSKKLAQQVDSIEQAGADLVSTGFTFIDENGNLIGPGYESRARTYAELLRGNGICLSSVLTRREALDRIGGFREEFRGASDWDAWLRIARLGHGIMHLDLPLVHYRIHEKNMSARYIESWRASVRLLRRHLLEGLLGREAQNSIAAIRGILRMGELYGAQAYDAFRKGRRPVDLTLALGLSPRYTVKALRRKLQSK